MYHLIKISRGREQVWMTDTLAKVRARMKQLREAQRGQKIIYHISPAGADAAKYKHPPIVPGRRFGGGPNGPAKIPRG